VANAAWIAGGVALIALVVGVLVSRRRKLPPAATG
jgi:hypothetical protein